jgi:hypothetical protein
MDALAKFGVVAAAAFCLITVPAQTELKIPDQVVAKWTEISPKYPARDENTLSVHAGTLECLSISFSKLYPNGKKRSSKIKLARVQRFSADTIPYEGSKSYRINVDGRGPEDLVETVWDPDEGVTVNLTGGTLGFVTFGADQRELRDDVFKKLCAMIGQKPVIGE